MVGAPACGDVKLQIKVSDEGITGALNLKPMVVVAQLHHLHWH